MPDSFKTFEDCIEVINNEINKRKHKWNLGVLAWLDYDDISQIIRIHIHKKWHLYDQNRPLSPWLNSVITSQMKNLIRNNYGNYCRPCLHCAAAEGMEGCQIYEKQCGACPLYANWEKSKKDAYNTKLPVSLELCTQEVSDIYDNSFDIERATENLHDKMQILLKPSEWKIYQCLYIEHKTDEDAAHLMGYRTSEKGRTAGYKMLKNAKKSIISKVKKCLFQTQDIDL